MNNASQYGLVRNAEPHAMALFFNQMQKAVEDSAAGRGGFRARSSMRVSGGTRFPFNMAFGAARDLGMPRVSKARQPPAKPARSASNGSSRRSPTSTTIPESGHQRSLLRREIRTKVSRHVAAYIDGAHSDPKNLVLVSAKHFPGHGDTNIDSHLDLPRFEAAANARRRGIETVSGRDRAPRRFHHDGAHDRARARTRSTFPPRFRPGAHRTAARGTRVQGPDRHRRDGHGGPAQCNSTVAKLRCARSKPARMCC